jgi:hypothetical protein
VASVNEAEDVGSDICRPPEQAAFVKEEGKCGKNTALK